MSVKFEETINYSITDCRGLSRAEMLSFIATDVITEKDIPQAFLYKLVEGPWCIRCIPDTKAVEYKYESKYLDELKVFFIPQKLNGMQIDYCYSGGSISVIWSAEEVMDMLGV